MNDNQNAFVKRPTSRVLAAPGGKSSMGAIFGGGMSTTNTNTKNDTSKKSSTPPPKEETEVLNNNTVASDITNKEEEAKSNNNNSVQKKKEEEESAISAAARIKQKNESQHFTLFPGGSNNVVQDTKVSANAFASAATTNSYNVLTDRPTSRVVSDIEYVCCRCFCACGEMFDYIVSFVSKML